jgi:hypothetical protein
MDLCSNGHAADARRDITNDAQIAALRRTYCRELVREDRLDWDGFDLGASDVSPSVAGVPAPADPARSRPWRPWRRRR